MSNVNLSDAFMLNDYLEGMKKAQKQQPKPQVIPEEELDPDTLTPQSIAENYRKYGESYLTAITQKIGLQENAPKEPTKQEKILHLVKTGCSTNYILSQINDAYK